MHCAPFLNVSRSFSQRHSQTLSQCQDTTSRPAELPAGAGVPENSPARTQIRPVQFAASSVGRSGLTPLCRVGCVCLVSLPPPVSRPEEGGLVSLGAARDRKQGALAERGTASQSSRSVSIFLAGWLVGWTGRPPHEKARKKKSHRVFESGLLCSATVTLNQGNNAMCRCTEVSGV